MALILVAFFPVAVLTLSGAVSLFLSPLTVADEELASIPENRALLYVSDDACGDVA